MIRRLVLAGAVVAGAMAGAGMTAVVQGGDAEPATSTTAPVPIPGEDVTGTEQLLLAWTSGGLPDGLAETAATVPGVSTVVVMSGGPIGLVAVTDGDGRTTPVGPDGWQIDLDAVAFDPTAAARIVAAADRPAVAALQPGQALLSQTEAGIRGVGAGAALHLTDGTVLTVAGIVSDEAIGGAEVAVTGRDLGPPRALVVAYEGDRGAVEQALAPAGTPIRFRAPGETPYLRAGDAVLPAAEIKATFGEFAHRGDEIDPAWVAADIVTEEVPLLGRVTCHRAIMPALRSAMTELVQKNLGRSIVTYDGCFVPRPNRNRDELSRHSWGVAIDLNFDAVQDPRVVEVMERWGFTWGGRWLIPDPAHFEYVRPAPAP